MSVKSHRRHFEGGLVTSALPSSPDVLLSRNKRRLGPCVDGSELARRIFTSQLGRCSHVFGLT
jgi:hypothetical protein